MLASRCCGFDDGKTLEPMAVLMHAVCHPCVFTWGDKLTPPFPNGYPKISADFPGEAQSFVEKTYGPGTHALFLQGCAETFAPTCRECRIAAATRPTSSGRGEA